MTSWRSDRVAEDDPAGRPARKRDIGKTIIRAGEVAGGISAIGGLVGDVLKPLAEVNLIVFLVASALTLLFLYLCLKRRTILGYGLSAACFFCLIVAVCFGAWWGVAESKGGQKQGILASKFALVGRVQEAVLDVHKVDGARVVSKLEKQEAGAKTSRDEIDALLRDYPATLLSAKTIGELRTSVESDDQVLVSYYLSLGVNPSAYDEFVAKLAPILDAAATHKDEVFIVAASAKNRAGRPAHEPLIQDLMRADGSLSDEKITELAMIQKSPIFQPGVPREWNDNDWWVEPVDPDREMVVVMNTTRNQVGDRVTWRWFHISKLVGLPTSERVNVSFLDSWGREVVRDVVKLGPVLPGLTLTSRIFTDKSWNALELVISPAIFGHSGYSASVTILRQLKMTRDELKRVASIRCMGTSLAERPR